MLTLVLTACFNQIYYCVSFYSTCCNDHQHIWVVSHIRHKFLFKDECLYDTLITSCKWKCQRWFMMNTSYPSGPQH